MILYRPVGTKEWEPWIPAEWLEEFNQHIIGKIQPIREFPEE